MAVFAVTKIAKKNNMKTVCKLFCAYTISFHSQTAITGKPQHLSWLCCAVSAYFDAVWQWMHWCYIYNLKVVEHLIPSTLEKPCYTTVECGSQPIVAVTNFFTMTRNGYRYRFLGNSLPANFATTIICRIKRLQNHKHPRFAASLKGTKLQQATSWHI